MRYDDEPVFDREWANGVWEYVMGGQARQKAADARNADLVRAHRDGWLRVAAAIENGLGGIAEALRGR